MVSYSTQLNPEKGTQQCPGATAFYNDTLYYIGNGHDATIWVLARTCHADSLNPSEDTGNEQNYWTQKPLQNEPNFQNFSGGCGTMAPPACAVADDSLYFVWIQQGGTSSHNMRVFATRLTPASGGGSMTWSAPVCLADSDGAELVMPTFSLGPLLTFPATSFAVTAWGDYLIACYKGSEQTFLLVYDTSDWPSGTAPSVWKATTQWSTAFADWPNFPAYQDLGGWISMDWFTPGGAKKGTASAAPAIYLIISFFNFLDDKIPTYILHAMDLTPFDQWTSGHIFAHWEVESRPLTSKGVNVIRDPAGRMRAYTCDSSEGDAIQYVTMPTNQVSPDGYSWASFGKDWSLLYGSAGKQSAHQAPVPVFVLGPSTTKQIKVGSETKQATVRQVYEFVMYENDGIKLVFSHFGEAVWVPDAYTVNLNQCLKPGAKPELVVTGLVDSPLPMPASNLQNQSTETVGSVEYGTTRSGSNDRSTSWSWSAGFMSEGYATAGAGPAWQISFNAGMAGSTGRSETTQIGMALTSTTQPNLAPQGNYFHGGVIFHRDAYLFYDVNLDGTVDAKPVSDAPTITSIWIEYTDLSNDSLQCYANTAGNLWSYTKAGWNARMQALGYAGDNYFDEVIAAKDKNGHYVNAVVFGSNPYLEYSWATSGSTIPQYSNVTSTFEESGWHLDARAYVGYSFTLGAEIFGVGEEQFGELLVGGSYSRTTEEKTSEGASWCISVEYDLPSPPSVRYPGQVTAVSWRLYLLKANKQWTTELIAYGDPTFKDQIDPNSAPWRIVFEVDPDSVVFQGDNRNLVYADANGEIIEAWYYPASAYTYGPVQEVRQGYWSWTNLSTTATPAEGSGSLPAAAGAPYWFAWGLAQPGAMPYTQAVVFRDASGDVYLLWSNGYEQTGGELPEIAWTWRSLAQTPGFVQAAGDPLGFHWQENPWGPNLHVIYRGIDGDLHEIHVPWTDQADGAWQTDNMTGSLPTAEKPASDPCAVVWDQDPSGPSMHVYYRAANNQIYGLYYDRATTAWTQTAVSAVTHDGATPTSKPAAFVWLDGETPSLHVGYRGSTGEIHDLYRQGSAWQPASDPSYAAHATASDQRAAEGPVCGIAWQRRTAPATIHWYYLTGQGDVCELWQGVGGGSGNWSWNNLSQQATASRGGGRLPPVAAIAQGQVWEFDPAAGSSISLYLRAQNGALYELRYEPTGEETGVWQWAELTGWIIDPDGNPLPPAAGG